MSKRLTIFFLVAVVLLIGGLLFFRYQSYHSQGDLSGGKIFEIKKGENIQDIAQRLQDDRLIDSKFYFFYYLWSHGLRAKILPGNFELRGTMTVPEIALTLTEGKKEFTKVTFPEGWTTKQMAQRLTANGLPGEDFLEVAENPSAELLSKFSFLAGHPQGAGLEGFLFPDTYFFSKEATGNGIVQKMLNNFAEKTGSVIPAEIAGRRNGLLELITLASIIEGEVRSVADKKIVSGIFLRRLDNSQRLQSCATIAYALGEKKKQYSFEDTRIQSPYNTYTNDGLPPGPISNPGLVSIEAVLNPTETEYNYFLSDPETGQTIFSRTIEEHNANKVKYGL